MSSLWTSGVDMPKREALKGNAEVDTAVIGAGMAGLLTAWFLQQEGQRVAVLEAGRVGCGQTSGTTAKITSQHGLIYAGLTRRLGREAARQYAMANQRAVEDYRRLADSLGIACDLEPRSAFVYAVRDAGRLEEECEAARALGLPARLEADPGLPFATEGALCFEEQAQFHPLKFLAGLARHLEIYENSRVQQVEGDTLTVCGHRVRAKQVVFASHFPFVNRPGCYFARMSQSRSYSMAFRGASLPCGMYLGADEEDLSLRAYKDLVILCGEPHNTGDNRQGGHFEALERRARELWPGAAEAARWSAQDCMTGDGVPYIGHYCTSTPNWYVATGFGKWGMSSSMAAARILSGEIARRPDPCAGVFSPQRFSLRELPPMAEEGARVAKGLALELFSIPRARARDLPVGHGGVVEFQGQTVGLYKQEDGTVYAVRTRCPHLGCQLEWNPDEKSWDCPCHGSRFDYTGKWLNGPAQEDLPSIHL